LSDRICVFLSLSRSTTESRLTKKTVDGQPFKWLRRPSICDEGQFQGVFNTHFFWMDQGNCWGWWLIGWFQGKLMGEIKKSRGDSIFLRWFWNFIFATENYHQKISSVDWFIFRHRFSHLESTQDLWIEFTSVNFLFSQSQTDSKASAIFEERSKLPKQLPWKCQFIDSLCCRHCSERVRTDIGVLVKLKWVS
jgi:hypothetical protein